jgi:phosphoglycolate phosphatase
VTSIRIFEKLANRNVPLSRQAISRLRGLTAYHVVRELRIRPWRVPWLLVRGRALMRREIDSISVFDGIEELLGQLKSAGVPIYIMSSNSPGNIRKLLHAKGMDHYFTHIYGNVGIFGKAKRLRQIIARNHLDRNRVVYIGDEGRDIEAAKRVGVKGIAVSWGFNNAKLLATHEPYALVRSVNELAKKLLG